MIKVSIVILTVKTEIEIKGLITEIKNTVAHKLDLIVVSGMRSVSVNRNIGMERAKGEFVGGLTSKGYGSDNYVFRSTI